MGIAFSFALFWTMQHPRPPRERTQGVVSVAAAIDPTYYFWTPSKSTTEDLKKCPDLPEAERNCEGQWCLRVGDELDRVNKQLTDWGLTGVMRWEVEGRTINHEGKSCFRHGYVWRALDDGDKLARQAGLEGSGQRAIVGMLRKIFGDKKSSPYVWVERVEHARGHVLEPDLGR